jgi:hypothetical protein
MDKVYAILFISILFNIINAQEPYYDMHQNKVIIEYKYSDLNRDKSSILLSVNYFASNAFVKGSSAVDYIDPDKGIMILKGRTNETGYTSRFNLTIRWRDNELKYTISDIVLTMMNIDTPISDEKQIKPNIKTLKKINKYVKDNIESAMNTNLSDDW